uniref:Major sperm protein n=1 Tax=Steinernema glaseri TaxID=37863 RepID=A0A1I8AU00_9BILA
MRNEIHPTATKFIQRQETSDGNDTSAIDESDDNAPTSRNNSDWETTTIASSQSSRSLRHRNLGELAKKENEVDVINQVEHYTLRFRVYKLCQLSDFVRYPHNNAPVAPGQMAIEVQLGKFKEVTSFVVASEETVTINEELYIPLMWPTVVKEV